MAEGPVFWVDARHVEALDRTHGRRAGGPGRSWLGLESGKSLRSWKEE